MPSIDHFIDALGRIHKSVRGNGHAVLDRVLTTCEEMLLDRGCVEVQRRDADLLSCIESGTRPVMHGIRSDETTTLVYVHAEDKVGIKYARAVVEHLSHPSDKAIIVSLDGPTPFTRKECDDGRVQFMLAKDLCVNKTKHVLVPRHVPVDAPPPGVRREDLPKILETDPIVQYYDFPHGTILKMCRTFGGHETIPYFRVVTAASS